MKQTTAQPTSYTVEQRHLPPSTQIRASMMLNFLKSEVVKAKEGAKLVT